MEQLTRYMEPVAAALELLGVAVILLSIVAATAKLAVDLRARHWMPAYNHYRANLGRGILLGLELLVGADIIATVTAPLTWTSVALLGLVVLIRTFLSFSLETESRGSGHGSGGGPSRRVRGASLVNVIPAYAGISLP